MLLAALAGDVAVYDPDAEDPYEAISARDAVPLGDVESHKGSFWPAARLLALCNSEVAKYNGKMSDLAAGAHFSRVQETVGRLEILRGLYRARCACGSQWTQRGFAVRGL